MNKETKAGADADSSTKVDATYVRQPCTKPNVRRSTVKLKDGLKLCPFCARSPEMQQHEGLNCWFVYCKCGLQSPKDSVSKNGAKVIWNRRRYVG